MDFNLSEEFPIEFKKIKKLGYETIEKRYLQPNMDTGIHSHPFTACMIILEGEISLANSHEKKLLKKGDFISVESNVSHHEKVGKKGVTVLYGKKFNENKYNLKIIEDSLDALYLGGNNNTISFITKTPASYILYLSLFKQHYSEIWLSQESILNLIPKRYASRSTILNLISDGINRKLIKKRSSLIDKRSVQYELGSNIFFDIEAWLKERKLRLTNMYSE